MLQGSNFVILGCFYDSFVKTLQDPPVTKNRKQEKSLQCFWKGDWSGTLRSNALWTLLLH